MGFWDEFRRGRDDIRGGQSAPPPPGGKNGGGRNSGRENGRNDSRAANPWDNGGWQQEPPQGRGSPGIAELEAALQQRDEDMLKALEIMKGLKEYAEQMQAQLEELAAGIEPMGKVLMLPGVKTFLLQRFHPDKHPEADEQQRRAFTEAMQAISAAYAIIAKGFQSPN
jgi:hypothetical protein